MYAYHPIKLNIPVKEIEEGWELVISTFGLEASQRIVGRCFIVDLIARPAVRNLLKLN